MLGDPAALPVPEVVVTHGSHGSTLYVNGRPEKVPAFPLPAEPTGAGDAFSISYVAARSIGSSPSGRRGLRDRRRRARCWASGDRARRDGRRHLRRRPRLGRGAARTTRSTRRPRRRSTCRAWSPPPRQARPLSPSSTRRPPMLVSHDGGLTWRESGRGLPPGARSRSPRTTPTRSSTRRATGSTSRGRRHLLDGARGRAARDRGGRASGNERTRRARRSPPSRRPAPARSARPSRRRARRAVDGRPISTPCSISISSPNASARAGRGARASGPAADPVAGSSATPRAGANMRTFQPPSARREADRPAARSTRASAFMSGCERRRPPRRDPSADHHVLHAVVVQLDRQHGAARCRAPRAARSARSNGSPRRQRLLHPAEADPRAFALELDRHDARARLDPQHDRLHRPAEHERRAERRVPGERQLGLRREDADPHVGALGLRRSTKTVSDRFVSRASACIVSESRSRASVKTASWLPASGVSVKTSRSV